MTESCPAPLSEPHACEPVSSPQQLTMGSMHQSCGFLGGFGSHALLCRRRHSLLSHVPQSDFQPPFHEVVGFPFSSILCFAGRHSSIALARPRMSQVAAARGGPRIAASDRASFVVVSRSQPLHAAVTGT